MTGGAPLQPRMGLRKGLYLHAVIEDALAGGDDLLLLHVLEAPAIPGLGAAFDDEGRGVVVELVGVRLEPAVRRLLEGEGESLEFLVRAEPDEAVPAPVELRLELIGQLVADQAGPAELVGRVLMPHRFVVYSKACDPVPLAQQVHCLHQVEPRAANRVTT